MKRLHIIAFTFVFICIFVSDVNAEIPGNSQFDSLSEVKKILLREIYRDHRVTFYCGSEFTPDKQVSHSNGYVPKKEWKPANRLEWEHIVPAHAFGQVLNEWREGHPECVDLMGEPFKGRECARKVVIKYKYMESDMYNLVPAVGEIKRFRSKFSFAMIPDEKRDFGTCDMEIENGRVEPPPEVRGNIARIYFYMNAAYPGHGIISNMNRNLFEAWDNEDPVDNWECERSKRIEGRQGNENPFVKNACIENELW